MLNLTLAVICSATIGLILKYSEIRGKNRLAVTTSNYFIAFIVSLLLFLKEDTGVSQNIFKSLSIYFVEFQKTLLSNDRFSSEATIWWSITVGLIGGFMYFLGFTQIQSSIKKNGIGLTGAFSKIAILIPIVLSIILWSETPTFLQSIGICITLVALFSISSGGENTSNKTFNISLFIMFLFVGLAEFINKLFQVYAQPEFNALFLFCVFLTAFIISLVVTVLKRDRVSMSDVVTGCIVGIPNMLTSYFLIRSFETIKASVVFPVYSSLAIILMAVGGVIIFSETLRKREITAIAMIIVALILINR